MKRFSFKLEKILELRKFREEECKLALGQAISALNAIENEIMKTAVRRHEAAEQRLANPQEMREWDYYILRLDREAESLAEQAAQAEMIVEEKRELYLEASRELKAVEKLKEKKQKEYRKELLDYEMAEIDDLTSARYGR
jgi:flagellar FliJ protein